MKRYLKQLQVERLRYLSDADVADDPQASVGASLRLSYDGLDSVAQTALCQLSMFPVSFDLAAADAVIELAGDIEALLDLLRRHSLLEWDSALQRYSLHDLVREFAVPLLQDSDAVQMRHARHYAQVVLQASHLYWEGGTAFLAGLELANRERVHIDTGWAWALKRAGDSNADALLLEYPNAMVYIGLRPTDKRERIPHLEAAVAVARQLEQPNKEIWHLTDLGTLYLDVQYVQQAIDCYEQVLAIARKVGNRGAEGNALGHLGRAHRQAGDLRQAIDYLKQGVSIAHEYNQRRREGRALENLGRAYADLGEVHQAIDFFEQSLNIWRESGDQVGEAHTSRYLGRLLETQGDLDQAAKLLQVYVDHKRAIGHPDIEQDSAHLDQLRQRLAAEQNTTPSESSEET